MRTLQDIEAARERPAAAPDAAAPLPQAAPASIRQWDQGARARYALALQGGYGNQAVARLARSATLAREVELGPGNYTVPEGLEQGYTVNSELEEMLARVARGEVSAGEAEAQMAGAEAAAPSATQTAARALANIASSGAAVTGVLGAFITIAATLATLSEAAEEREVGDQIVAATDGFVAGFMSGVGWGMKGGDPAWFADGHAKGAAATAALVAKCKADPALQAFDIGPDEVLMAIRDRRDAFHKELYAAVKPQIANAYLTKWRDGLGWMTTTFTNEKESGERRIRTRAGMPLNSATASP